MATAPTPGKAGRDEAASTVIRITTQGETWEFMPAAVSMAERIQVRKQVGLPFEQFAAGETSIGEDTLAVFLWMAKRQNGRPKLTWAKFIEHEWSFDPDDFDVEQITDDPQEPTDIPEGSGPGSETPSLA